ncbi:zinc-dependent alcohol dehydrogenase family protein [Lichenihabitans sp. Uapishka_5]|uniref:zinc-dependent alcohol dehydrogenase family protein n=1 Tax=Lichenihabitans sp. Uapishka_5 TaxID=3037302 RepID=UPI0029E7EA5C|nr:zinc-dependent alcohol dehydrogenase family protein [Lichenihabitans sp. Uapishka_5]MDX7951870.1 zinc-dependent alcohol dehydrogenase family protein [Lichenihabitans sp. Uapishka_5]
MKAVRLEGLEQLFLRDVAPPEPGPGELLVRVEASGVCGTDRHLLHGSFPSTPPVTIGHEFCGIVEALGPGASGFAIGDRITADPNIVCGRCEPCQKGRINLCRNLRALGIQRDGGFATHAIVPQSQAYGLPASVKPEHGAFCEPIACCLHGIDMAQIQAGATVAVLGGGVIGLLTVQLARLAGARQVVLSTRQASRRRLAEDLGATATVDPTAGDPVAAISGPGGVLPGGADVVIECAGVPDTMRQMTHVARAGGTVVVLGVMPKGETVAWEPFDVLFRELRVLGSFINPFTHRRAAELVAAGTLQLDPLVTRRMGLDEVVNVVRQPAQPGEVKAMAVA